MLLQYIYHKQKERNMYNINLAYTKQNSKKSAINKLTLHSSVFDEYSLLLLEKNSPVTRFLGDSDWAVHIKD